MQKSFTDESIRETVGRLVECFPQLTEGLNELRNTVEKIKDNYNKLAYPEHPNWDYCVPLAPNYTLKDGTVVDIGIYVDERMPADNILWRISANFVWSNEGHDYTSGHITPTSEVAKVALRVMLWMEIIDEDHILRSIGKHNSFLSKFMNSDLTLWDMQDWIDGNS